VASDARDRRDDGRPEQARPRDRTGRPLAYGTTGVPLTEDHDPATVEEALVLGARLWDERRFFEAHECLEQVWHAAPEDDRDLWQGVIQIAVAGVHLQRGNPVGAAALLERAGDRLARYPGRHRGIEAARARAFCLDAMAMLADGAAEGIELPAFPATAEGAWFTPDPDALEPPTEPTPVPDEPVWLAAGQPRRPRTRSGGSPTPPPGSSPTPPPGSSPTPPPGSSPTPPPEVTP
jgi:uncharacterized protein